MHHAHTPALGTWEHEVLRSAAECIQRGPLTDGHWRALLLECERIGEHAVCGAAAV